MADVDMPDAGTSGPSKAKAPVKASKAGNAADPGSDGKKRFEVKKVQSPWAISTPKAGKRTDDVLVERRGLVGLGHCRRQLRHLQKPHYGSLHRVSSESSISYQRGVHGGVGYLQCEHFRETNSRIYGSWSV